MFKITLSPVLGTYGTPFEEPLTVRVIGKTLIVCGKEFDFTDMKNGDLFDSLWEATNFPFFTGECVMEGDTITVGLSFPVGIDSVYVKGVIPDPILVSEDGPVDLPDSLWPPAPEPEYPEEPQPEPEDDSEER